MKYLVIALLALVLGFGIGTRAQGLRDPFVRPAPPASAETAPETSEPPPRLRAIMYTPGRSLANINGQILATGEWFGDHQVTNIRERSVTLVRRGVKSVLRLDEASGK
jgi:hypothetical protein